MTQAIVNPLQLFFHGAARLLRPLSDRNTANTKEPALPTLLAYIILGGGIYGAAMGAFLLAAATDTPVTGRPALQLLYSAIKVPLLLLVTFALVLPNFFVLNTLLGLRSDFREAVKALVSAQAALALILAALAPFVLLWYASSRDYPTSTTFNGLMFAIACFAAQWPLMRRYQPLIQRNPRHRWMLALWLLLYIFVAIQMAWTLRPYLGSPASPTTFFRKEPWGNAYEIVLKMVWRVLTH